MQARDIAEIALEAPDRVTYRRTMLESLDRAVGFDLANLGHTADTVHYHLSARGFDTDLAASRLNSYMAEFEAPELAAMSTGRMMADSDIVSARRRDRLAMYSELLRPHGVRALATAVWRNRFGGYGFVLARTGPGARFSRAELRRVGSLLPFIRLAESFFGAAESSPTTAHDGRWELIGDRFSFSAREREVSQLVVRGLQNREIAVLLGMSHHTVRNHLAAIFRKATVTTRAELVYILGSAYAERDSRARAAPRWFELISHYPAMAKTTRAIS